MPSPTETLLRIQLSPVPTQTFLWLEGSTVTAPMDCTPCLSNTGVKVVPPLRDFHTPPLAEPANKVIFPFSSTASMALMRPLMVADPMFRILKPEMVAESNFTGRGVGCACAPAMDAAHMMKRSEIPRIAGRLRKWRWNMDGPL